MLISQHGGEPDQDEPNVRGVAQNAASVARVKIGEERAQGDVKRRQQIVRLIHSAKPIEERAEPAGRMRAFECETQREQQKANATNQDRGGDPFRECRQFAIVSAEKRRRDEEKIDRHVRRDHQRHERNGALPFEEERRHIAALRGEPVGPSVDDKKKRRESYRRRQLGASKSRHWRHSYYHAAQSKQ